MLLHVLLLGIVSICPIDLPYVGTASCLVYTTQQQVQENSQLAPKSGPHLPAARSSVVGLVWNG
jgi:hypothetical protein